ncbi:hypothetical protein Q3G72_023850 [Acer saccharum]|nr:hypothetical protein Q3G72_023850 [Acer saccharum]
MSRKELSIQARHGPHSNVYYQFSCARVEPLGRTHLADLYSSFVIGGATMSVIKRTLVSKPLGRAHLADLLYSSLISHCSFRPLLLIF